jgi:transketolase
LRTTFIKTLCELAEEEERIWLLTGDLGFSVLEHFVNRFPNRYVNVGVAEQNMTGVAAGLAMSGKIVFTYSIANFPTFRCLEQIRNDVCYHQLDVKIVAVGGGLAYGSSGYTHHAVEDLAVMRAMPNMKVVAPGDPFEAREVTRAVARERGPCYLRLGKAGEPYVHQRPPACSIGRAIPVREGFDAAVLSTGGMLQTVVGAAEICARRGSSVAVYSVPWIKPLDVALLRELAQRFALLVTVEEARSSGGLGGAVAELLAGEEAPKARLIRIGLEDSDICDVLHRSVFSQEAARAALGFDSEGIAGRVLEALR